MPLMHQTMAAVGYVVFGAAVYLVLILLALQRHDAHGLAYLAVGLVVAWASYALAVWNAQSPARWLVMLGSVCSMVSIGIPAAYIVSLIFRV